MNAYRHIGFFPAAVGRAGLQGLENFGELVAEEDADDRWGRLAAAEPVIIAGGSHGSAEQILILVHGLDDSCQETEELGTFMGTVAGIQQIVTGVCEHGPVVVFAAAVDAFKGLFSQKADKIMPQGDFFHHFHGDLVMVAGDAGHRVDRGHFMLGRGGFVMLGFREHAELPELFV